MRRRKEKDEVDKKERVMKATEKMF